MRSHFGANTVSALLLLSAFLAVSPEARSAPITFYFTGSVSSITDPLNAFAGVGAGTAISGSYTFESTTADTAGADSTVGRYPGTLSASTLTIGGTGLTFVGSPNQITVNNQAPGDGYSVFAGFSGLGGYTDIDLAAMGGTGPASLFANDSLPLTPAFFSGLTATFFNMQFFTGAGPTKQQLGSLSGTLSSLTQRVPEPGSLALLGLGLVSLGMSRRSKAS